ncbi:MAG TPA: MBL fold hydrolase [Lachnospiraceae bacterium]|nr:MBL fold hydrolase [Lachnospiraceae bacterium]
MKVAVLTENTACRPGIGHEHGLSLYIESCGSKILFDFGQSDLFLANAGALGIDLAKVDFGVLSHGHYDHGGGIRAFLMVNSRAPVYLGGAAFEKHYNAARKNIGLNEDLKAEERLIPLGEEYQAAPGIRIFHCNDRKTVIPIEPFGLSVLKENAFIPEDFRHEQYLEITEAGKKILFSGCSHKGILNIAEWTKPDVLIGGFHLMKVALDDEGKKKLKDIAERLLSGHTRYYTCHCTGNLQYDYLKQIMGDRLNYLSAGTEVNI